MALPHLGMPELIIIFVVILMLFGVGKLPQVGGAIGKGLRAFKKGQQGEELEEQPEKEAAKAKRKTAKQTTKSSGTKKI